MIGMTGLINPAAPFTGTKITFKDNSDKTIERPFTGQFIRGFLAVHYNDMDYDTDNFIFINPDRIADIAGVKCVVSERYAFDSGLNNYIEFIDD